MKASKLKINRTKAAHFNEAQLIVTMEGCRKVVDSDRTLKGEAMSGDWGLSTPATRCKGHE